MSGDYDLVNIEGKLFINRKDQSPVKFNSDLDASKIQYVINANYF